MRLLEPEPHRHALARGIALSGLLHAAALGLRPPALIEPAPPQPLRATSFVVDMLDHDTPSVLTAPLASRSEPPASPAPQPAAPAPRVAPSPRIATAPITPMRVPAPVTPSAVPAPSVTSEPAPAPLGTPTSESATSSVPAGTADEGDAAGAATSATGTGSAGTGTSPAATSGSSHAIQARVAASRARYLRTLTARIRQHRQYPYLARRQGLEGTVCLLVSLGARGQLMALRVTCGAESEALVEAAKSAVTEAAPFEPLPTDLGTSLAVEVPIVFRLEEG
jgi:TonB family protein